MTQPIPASCDVAILGGGPAGSTAATLLAKAGVDTVLLDRVRHPRPQVGESLIPQVWKFLDLVGATDKILADGFVEKSGGIVIWDGKIRQIRFKDFGFERSGMHVERDRFDEILLRHSQEHGAQVFEEVMARSGDFSDPRHPVIDYEDRRGGGAVGGKLRARYVIDATGNAAVIAGNSGARHRVGSDGKYLGVWGYFKDSLFLAADRKVYPAGMCREVRPVTFVMSYKDGWIWHIVMRDVTSVGLIVNTAVTKGMGRREQERYFLEVCRTTPYLRELLEPATYVEDSIVFRPDYSYYSTKIAGDGFCCIGDAAAFVDPIFSQGVVFAMYGGGLASWVAKAVMGQPERADFYRDLFTERTKQFYGFSRLLAFGDFGGEGIDPESVRRLVLSMPRNEIELSLAASSTTERSGNLLRMLHEAGIRPDIDDACLVDHSETLSAIALEPRALQPR